MGTLFREPEPEQPKVPERKREEPKFGPANEDVEDYRPVETDQDLLRTLGIQDDIKVLPKEDFDNLQELKSYLNSYMGEKGLPSTQKGIIKAVEKLKGEMGLDSDAEPQALIEKVGRVSKAWKELSFIKDFEEKKRILIRLISAGNPREMERIVLDEMTKKQVWQ